MKLHPILWLINMSNSTKQRWFPLESNPELVNDYVRKLGFTGSYDFVDVFSTEDWALQMIPQPVQAVMLLYPLTKVQTSYADPPETVKTDSKDVWFIKQRIGNACGTIALLHAMLNGPKDRFASDSWLSSFATATDSMTPLERAEHLEGDKQIAEKHDQATSSERNSTSRGSLEDNVLTHFVALVEVNGELFELDGRKAGPVSHGPCENLLVDACKVIKKFMDRDPAEMRFTIMAMAPK